MRPSRLRITLILALTLLGISGALLYPLERNGMRGVFAWTRQLPISPMPLVFDTSLYFRRWEIAFVGDDGSAFPVPDWNVVGAPWHISTMAYHSFLFSSSQGPEFERFFSGFFCRASKMIGPEPMRREGARAFTFAQYEAFDPQGERLISKGRVECTR